MVADSLDRTGIETLVVQFPGPVRLTAAKTAQKVILFACLVFEFVLAKSLLAGQGIAALLVALMLLVLCQIAWLALLLFKRGALDLTLNGEGFTIRYPLASRSYAWKNVGEFKEAASRTPLFDMTSYNDRSPGKRFMRRPQATIAMFRFGRNATLPDTYGLGSDRLAALMTAWQQRALSKRQ